MTETKKQRRIRAASNSFKRDELVIVLDLLRVARRGGDASVLMRAASVPGVERKFAGMLARLDAHRAAQP